MTALTLPLLAICLYVARPAAVEDQLRMAADPIR